MKKYILEIIVFLSGGVLMVLELAGSRIVAPYLGVTITIWTSLIGIILGSLSIGYWWGGKLADKNPSFRRLSLILFVSALLVAIIVPLKSPVLEFAVKHIADSRAAAVFAIAVLFSPSSIVLGIVSPYAVRLKMHAVSKSGETVGNLYAISTLGSIAGTFLGGFYLIVYFGNTKILLLLSGVLVFTALLSNFNKITVKAVFLIIAAGLLIGLNKISGKNNKNVVYQAETLYNSVRIADSAVNKGKSIRYMIVNGAPTSAMNINDDNDLLYDYAKFFNLAKYFKPDLKKTLMIGGAAYLYPKYYLNNFPDAKIDVVEIDPKLTELAKKYFRLKDDSRLTVYHEDGRIFLNRTKNKYDAVLGDAFNFFSLPYQLTTIEAIQKTYDALVADGVVIVNIVSSIDGEFLRAEYRTYREVFPQVYLFPLLKRKNRTMIQSVMLVAIKGERKPSFNHEDPEMNRYLKTVLTDEEIKPAVSLLTDDYAPVDYYMMKLYKRRYL